MATKKKEKKSTIKCRNEKEKIKNLKNDKQEKINK